MAIITAGPEAAPRDIVLHPRDAAIKRISEIHRSYDALQYPLICARGEDGYQINIKQVDPITRLPVATKTVSSKDFYAYRLMYREHDFNLLLRCQTLFQQYCTDMYAKIESERLIFIKTHQRELRCEQYVHLRDGINNDNGGADNIGRLCILPSSFTGSPRYMHERTQDAMTYVRAYGRPDLFITFTCNPTWPEVKEHLIKPQQPAHRNDLTARIFRLKIKKLMDTIKKDQGIFGKVRCDMYTIEWQKRGLPHAHLLIWLETKIHSNQLDSFISAELPNPDEDPQLFDIIKKQMVHGPCGALNRTSSCMKDGQCTKKYPRKFMAQTETDHDGYPLYRRRKPGCDAQGRPNGGFDFQLKMGNRQVTVDNRWVVPHCPLLSKEFNAHINVEFCSSVKSIQYICKYVNKGSDAAMFGLQNPNSRDEVAEFVAGRYISSNEGVWRTFAFPIHERHPAITTLAVHLENGQRVYFTPATAQQQAETPKETTLTGFFQLCQEDDFAKTLLYNQVPNYYTWTKKWSRRKQGERVDGHPGIFKATALGRVYTIHPSQEECFFLRMLLHEVQGPTSFQALRTVDNHVCVTYREACNMLGLLEDDAHWHATLTEAAASQSPFKLRNLFAILLQTCGVSDPPLLWIQHREDLTEDFKHRAQLQMPGVELDFTNEMFNQALIAIEDKVMELGGRDLSIFGLPRPDRTHAIDAMTREVLRETSYHIPALENYVTTNEPKLLPDQRTAYNMICDSVVQQRGEMFFLNAPGGTGKTFVTALLLAKARSQKRVSLAVASSGIAATLLAGGRTAHATFKLPLNLATNDSPTCNISKGSSTARVLQLCQLIIWDECTMSHKAAFEAVDRTLQDIRGNNRLMGGVTFVMAGDFRQTLPVITRGTRADEIKACIKSSVLWRSVMQLTLSTNMRAQLLGDPAGGEFAEKLLQLGNGQVSLDAEGQLSVAQISQCVASVAELQEQVFPNLHQHYKNHRWLRERAILAPKNDMVHTINAQLITKVPGAVHTYNSVDTVQDEDQVVHYPVEFLHSLNPPGVPPHRLQLKEGAPIMLLRNMDPPKLCNGTRLVVKKLMPHVIEATIITGCASGEDVFIPRIPIIPTDMPFNFKRLQFPIKLSFAMSINKAQGQTLKVAGLHLGEPCFSHGQLYVGCSRVGTERNLYILAPNKKTKNIVYPEALR